MCFMYKHEYVYHILYIFYLRNVLKDYKFLGLLEQ